MKTADSIKNGIPPGDFYSEELVAFSPSRREGWVDGGLCPFHDDHRPGSFKVNLDTGAFKCFACGTGGGDIIAFLMKRDGSTFREALDRLLTR